MWIAGKVPFREWFGRVAIKNHVLKAKFKCLMNEMHRLWAFKCYWNIVLQLVLVVNWNLQYQQASRSAWLKSPEHKILNSFLLGSLTYSCSVVTSMLCKYVLIVKTLWYVMILFASSDHTYSQKMITKTCFFAHFGLTIFKLELSWLDLLHVLTVIAVKNANNRSDWKLKPLFFPNSFFRK